MTTSLNPDTLRRQRVEYNFRKKHGDDGYERLMEYAETCEYLEKVATDFGVTRARISQILEVLLGMPYALWLAQHGVARKKVSRHDKTV